ncbi:MAG: protein YcaR in KDO2-Lipid A biosynthesis cluster [Acidimicrobiaceae bacterium]|nr:protein YcaR in KDO2-Lipid A biosynthesis cluster [Acidimicrobiaceae bacterium]MEC7844048.1 Trm112 family protein [Actinomycetota bacterium]
MALDQQLLEILACPEDKGELMYFENENILYNPRLRRAYPIRDGIPVLLVNEAEEISEERHTALLTD